MDNVSCKICNEIVDLDSDEMSEASALNQVHEDCLSAYFDYLSCVEESKRTGKNEFHYPTKEMLLLAKIFNVDESFFRRPTKAFQRILNGDAHFKYRRI